MATPRRLRHAELVLVRASTDPGGLSLPRLDLHTAEDAETTGREWLTELWGREVVRTAFDLASPALCEQIAAVVDGAKLNRRSWRRLLVSTCSYVLRWQQRPTPFGLFAGVTTAAIGGSTRVIFGEQHQLHRQIDPNRLHELISELESDPEALAKASLVVNNAGTVRGDRFVVPNHLSGSAEDKSSTQVAAGLDEVELALRRTRPVDAALAAARVPIPGLMLFDQLHREFPSVPRKQVAMLISGLVAHRVLVTSLRAPSACPNPVEHVLAQLDDPRRDSEENDHVGDAREDLRSFFSSGSHAKTTVSEAASPARSAPPSSVDVSLDGRITLPEPVLREAESAASVLLEVTPSPFGTAPWRDYHLRFRERYGSGALVPVRELISDSGLGFPTGFLGAAREQGARLLTDRDAALQATLQETVLDGRTEVALSEELIEQLSVGDHRDLTPPERVELAFTIHTTSTESLDQGRFQLWVTGAPVPTSSMAGRFAAVLDEHARQRLSHTYPTGDEVMVAQLSFPPRRNANEAVTRTPDLLPWLLPIGEHPPELGADSARLLHLDDLAVTASSAQFFLIHRPSGKPVHPYVPHALETTVYTPPLARFLAELPTARRAVFGPIDFGASRTLRFLPRIRHGRSVLSPARWLLHATDLPGPRTTSTEWEQALSMWRERWRVPAHVLLVEGEQRLPLDLDELTQRSLLRVRLRRAGKAELREAGDPARRGWTGRACEFLVPLTASPSPSAPPVSRKVVVRDDSVGSPARNDGAFPGASSLVLSKLEGHPQRFDTILTEHLPNLRQHLGDEIQRLWFRRQHDTTRPDSDHSLQLWLRLTSADRYGSATTCLAEWAEDLRASGLLAQVSFETAWAQPGKYGDLSAAEPVFAADSAAALAEISCAEQLQLPRSAVAAVSMVDLATALASDAKKGWEMVIASLPQQTGPLDAVLRENALRFARDLRQDQPPARDDVLRAAWTERREALETYRAQLDRPPESDLRALLHEHFRRTIAVSREQEETTNRLARAVALQALALAQRGVE
ncbi:MAG: lantibiotic dehydratase [Saccharopolyspora sp.]|uniref:lantibiotic dehydratase n=1 Tax=Saccharopolyspora sp. TaxID=33915 RepID=UPI0025CD5F5B|nr:lantibiotic dehydratase [Saccharopolyspora sp.]MBQ6642099.1 lantibiotic dehydratase [Saccharopolyspora sp.]